MAEDLSAARAAFARIYRNNGWWGQGSGPGSSPANTIEYRSFVSRFIEANAVRSVTDFGCGDWQFSRYMDWSGIEYIGLDVVPEIVECNRNSFGQSNLHFEVFTSSEALTGGDLLLAKELLQHLPNSTIIEYLSVIRQRYRFALLTNAVEPLAGANGDIEPGDFRPIRLQDPPFEIPGAVVFTYYPQSGTYFFKNAVFLMPGCGSRRQFPVGSAKPSGPVEGHRAR